MNEAPPDDFFLDQIIDNGEIVYSLFWNSDAPGIGGEYENIYRFEEQYYPILSFEESVVAYNTLEEALDASEMTSLNESSQEIMSKEINTDRLVQLLHYQGDHDVSIVINGERWLAITDGKFQKIG